MRSKLCKSVVALLLILSMIIPNIAINANAEDKIDDCTIAWEEFDADAVSNSISTSEIPTKANYLFAGWYTQQTDDMDSLKSYALRGATPSGTTYALFVPDDVLGVKAQVSAHLVDGEYTNSDNSASIRFVTSIPSLSFKEVGLEVTYIGSDNEEHTSYSKGNTVYSSMYEVGSDSGEPRQERPWTLFCGVSKYFKAHTITGVSKNFYETEFEVTPYWVTLEGQRVTVAEPITKTIAQGAKVNLEINSGENGTVSTDKDWYLQGQEVILTVEGEEGYAYNSLKVNNEEVTLDSNKQYKFNATASNKVSAAFAEKIFKDNEKWDLINQNKGVVSIPAGTNAKDYWLQLDKTYKDIDITVKARDYGTETQYYPRTDVFFVFDDNGTKKNLSIGITYNGSAYRINADANADSTLYGTAFYNQYTMWGNGALIGDEINQYKGEGVDLRLARAGGIIRIYVGERLVDMVDLTQGNNGNTGVNADAEATVYIRHKNDTSVEKVIPFTVSETVDNTFSGDISFSHKNTTLIATKVIANPVTDFDLTLTTNRNKTLTSDSEKFDILLDFDNGKNLSFYLGIVGGNWSIASLNRNTADDIYARNTVWHTLDNTQKLDFLDRTLDFRLVRKGTNVLIFLGDQHITTVDLTNNGANNVSAQTTATVTIKHYGTPTDTSATVAVNIPFTMSTTADTVTGDIAFSHKSSTLIATQVLASKVTDMDLTLTTNRNKTLVSTSEKFDILFDFDNGKNLSFYLGIVDGNWSIASLNRNTADDIYARNTVWHTLDNTQKLDFLDRTLDFRLVRKGTNILIFLGDQHITTVDLTNNGANNVSAETTATVTIKHYGTPTDTSATVAVNIPFTMSTTVDTVTGDIAFSHKNTTLIATQVLASKVTDMDLTLTTNRNKTLTSDSEKFDILFDFDNGKNLSFYLGIVGGNWSIASLNRNTADDIYARNTVWHTLDSTQRLDFLDRTLDFRLVRTGTNVLIYLGDQYITTVDLTNNGASGVTAQTTATVTIKHYGTPTDTSATVAVSIPFTLSTP